MEDIRKSAYIIAQAAVLNARVAGMVAENQDRIRKGESLAYIEEDFRKLVDKSSCGHNEVISYLYNY